MGFLRRVHGLTFRNKVRNCENRNALNVEPLLLRIKIQVTPLRPRDRNAPKRLARRLLHVGCTQGKATNKSFKTRWRDYTSDSVWRFGPVPMRSQQKYEAFRGLPSRAAAATNSERINGCEKWEWVTKWKWGTIWQHTCSVVTWVKRGTQVLAHSGLEKVKWPKTENCAEFDHFKAKILPKIWYAVSLNKL